MVSTARKPELLRRRENPVTVEVIEARAAVRVARATHQGSAFVRVTELLTHEVRVPPRSPPLVCVSNSKTTPSFVG